jgi:hypothetical protein
MNNFSDWTQRMVPVASLKLDTKNPRLPNTGKEPEIREIVAELIETESVLDLARDIAEQGYFPTEILVAVTEDGSSVVIEGNRRLAALKLLLSPELGPDDLQKRLHVLKQRVDSRRLREVPVLFAPSREAAAPLIISRHTQLGVRGWSPVQQAKYVRSLAAPDMAVDDLAKLLGMDRASLVVNLRTDAMYQVACDLDLDPAALAVVRNPRDFNTSVFERLMQSAAVQEFLGLTFDDKQKPKSALKQEEFHKAFKRMVSDIATKTENTRSLNSVNDIKRYLGQLGADKPDPTRVEPHDPTPAAPPPEPARPNKAPKGKTKGPATPRPTVTLIPRGIRSQLKSTRINAIFQELRQLKVATFPNATAVMLRIFLDMAVGHYMDKTKKIEPILAAARKKGKSNDWYPTLRQMLNELLKAGDIKLGPQVRRRLNKMVSQDDHPLSLDEIDQFVHSRFALPTEAHLRSFWEVLEELIEVLLVEPPAPPSPAKPGKN